MKSIAEMNFILTSLAEPEIFNNDNFAQIKIVATAWNGDMYELHVEDHKVIEVNSFDKVC